MVLVERQRSTTIAIQFSCVAFFDFPDSTPRRWFSSTTLTEYSIRSAEQSVVGWGLMRGGWHDVEWHCDWFMAVVVVMMMVIVIIVDCWVF